MYQSVRHRLRLSWRPRAAELLLPDVERRPTDACLLFARWRQPSSASVANENLNEEIPEPIPHFRDPVPNSHDISAVEADGGLKSRHRSVALRMQGHDAYSREEYLPSSTRTANGLDSGRVKQPSRAAQMVTCAHSLTFAMRLNLFMSYAQPADRPMPFRLRCLR
jgi:hypothetical protein